MRVLHGARAGLVLAGLLALPGVSVAADKPEDAAQKAAEVWLKQVDQAKYGESWESAASLFKGVVTRDQWTQAATAVRAPLGKVLSRTLKSRQFSKTLPGAPDGQYVVIQYDSAFEKKAAGVETVTAAVSADGAWRVGGYLIN